jgi:hypothetical protein
MLPLSPPQAPADESMQINLPALIVTGNKVSHLDKDFPVGLVNCSAACLRFQHHPFKRLNPQ